jgi:NhaP-type Na+/H+ or K+/H+ antiporter
MEDSLFLLHVGARGVVPLFPCSLVAAVIMIIDFEGDENIISEVFSQLCGSAWTPLTCDAVR